VPVGIGAFALTPLLLAESRDARAESFDLPGAALVTGGLVVLVYALTQASDYGWVSTETIGFFAASAALLGAFVAWEARTRDPLMPFSIFRLRTLVGANVAGVVLGTVVFSMFLMLTLYMQQVLHYSPLKTGVAYLAVAGTAIVWSAVAKLVTRVGVKPVLVAGMAFLTAGLAYFTQVSVGGSYLGDLLPGFLLIAIRMGFSFVPISIAALAGVEPSEAGLASGLINTSQQIGGARDRRAVGDRHIDDGRGDRGRQRASVRAHRRLPGRVRRRSRHGARRRASRARHRASPRSRATDRRGAAARARGRIAASDVTPRTPNGQCPHRARWSPSIARRTSSTTSTSSTRASSFRLRR
jgi:hypothetical protein